MKRKNQIRVLFTVIIAVVLLAASGYTAVFELVTEQPASTVPIDGANARIWFFDVGQGDSQLIRLPDNGGYFNILIDTGEPQYAEGLEEIFDNMGIKRLDVLISTHPHADHMGGMSKIIRSFDIGELYMPKLPDDQTPTTKAYESLLDAVIDKDIAITPIFQGMKIPAPGAVLEVLSPREEDVWDDINNYSAVLLMTYGESRLLLTGDAEYEAEMRILELGTDIQADILAVGHHGSKSSTAMDFLSAISPNYAIISCGYDNSYGHPHNDTLRKLNESGIEIFRTDLHGTIMAELDGQGITIEAEVSTFW